MASISLNALTKVEQFDRTKQVESMSEFPASLDPPPMPAEVMARAQQLEPFGTDNVKDQHVVSQVVLAQFAEPWGKKQERLLSGLSLAYVNGRPRRGGPDMFGKFPNFVSFASRQVEQVWKETEDKLNETLSSVRVRSVFESTEHVQTIRDTVVLHFVRSIPAKLLHQQVWKRHQELHRQKWRRYPKLLERLFYQRHGFYAAGPEALEIAADDLVEEVRDMAERDVMFRVSLEDRFWRFRNAMRDFQVEILTSGCSEFLIGDVPALTIKYDCEPTGIFGGVGLAVADEIVLPLGPTYMAVLQRRGAPGFRELSEEEVCKYNTRQVKAAFKHVHFRTESGLEELVRSVEQTVPNVARLFRILVDGDAQRSI